MKIVIRRAVADDAPSILALIKELAEYEKEPDAVINTVDKILADGFSANPIFSAFVAESETKEVIGMALYYTAYSTWKGRIFYLDDIVVTESWRRKGVGEMLLEKVLEQAKIEAVAQVRWQVLEWNKPAIDFYKKWDVEFDGEWVNCRYTP